MILLNQKGNLAPAVFATKQMVFNKKSKEKRARKRPVSKGLEKRESQSVHRLTVKAHCATKNQFNLKCNHGPGRLVERVDLYSVLLQVSFMRALSLFYF